MTFPTLSRAPSQFTFELRSTVFVHESPYNKASQRVAMAGADAWAFQARWPALSGRDLDLLEGFFASMAGRANTFTLSPWGRREPTGTVRGTGTLASGVAQFATAMTVNGVGAGNTVRIGDLVQLGNQVHRSLTDATANGSGQIVLSVRPPARLAQTAGAVVTFSNPTITWRLDEDVQGVERGTAGLADIFISAVEAL